MPEEKSKPQNPALTKKDTLAVSCFFISGFIGLVYEICWIRKASLSFGSTTLALSTVVAVFFGGLALGSYLFGNYSHKTARPLKVYAWLEMILGVTVLMNPLGFDLAEELFGLFYPFLENNFELLSLGRLVVVALLLLPPTVLMGGTLPLFCRQYVRQENKITLSVGMLYGINTLGAAAGCFTCGFWLIPWIGVNQSIWLGGVINILIGLSVLKLQAGFDPISNKKDPQQKTPVLPRSQPPQKALVSVLFFFSGFVALGNEIIWTRFFSLIIHNTVYTYTLTLAITLVGIVIGSLLVSVFSDRTRFRAMLFGAVHLLTGLCILVILLLPQETWKGVMDSQQISGQLKMFLLVLLPPALLSGMSYPLAIRLVLDSTRMAGLQVGRMTAVNTLGGIVGSLALGFVLVPVLGLHASLLISTGISLVIGMAGWLLVDRESRLIIKIPVLAACALAWFLIPSGLGTKLPEDYLATEGQLIEFREGLRSHLSVVKTGNRTLLKIDRLWQGQDQKSHQIMAAHIPMLLHPDPKQVVVIGLGVGQTTSRFLMYPIQTLDCVEIERELLTLLKRHFDSTWMKDPRVRFIIEDGRNYLAHTKRSYDIISIEVGQVFRPGLASFYTVDFYTSIKNRVNPGGLVAQFVPIGFLDPKQFQAVIASFIKVFPKSVLYYNTYELLLMGSPDTEPRLSQSRLQVLSENQAVYKDLQYAYWGGPKTWLNRPEVILAGFLSGSQSLSKLAKDSQLYHDTLPRLEYQAAKKQQIRSPEPILNLIRKHLDPLELGIKEPVKHQLLAVAEEIRRKNLGEIMATFLFQQFVSTENLALLSRALQWNNQDLGINMHMGLILARQGNLSESVGYFSRILDIDPSYLDAHINLGVISLELNQVETAVDHLTQAVKLQPNSLLAQFNLGRALSTQGKTQEAKDHFQLALKLAESAGQTDWINQIFMQLEKISR